jgi:ethanolamine utilization protein EutP
MMKNIILIGPRGVGKTSLMQRLRELPLSYKKTQAAEYYDSIVDTPGEFIQYRRYYSALQMLTHEVDIACLCLSAEGGVNSFPPNFAQTLSKPCIGIVTHIDIIKDKRQIDRAHEHLESAGVDKIFDISSITDEGIVELKEFLFKDDKNS